MLKQIENLLNIEAGSLEKENGLDIFKSAISDLREASEKIGEERIGEEKYKAGERSTFKKLGQKLIDLGFEDVDHSNLLSYLDTDAFKTKLGSKEITAVDIKNSDVYKTAVRELQTKISEAEKKQADALSQLNQFQSRTKKEALIAPLLSSYNIENRDLLDLVKANVLNQYEVDDNGNALKNGTFVEDEIKNPIKFETLVKAEFDKFFQAKEENKSPHNGAGSSKGKGIGAIAKLSEHGLKLPTNSNELSQMIRDVKLPIEFRQSLTQAREEIEASFDAE